MAKKKAPKETGGTELFTRMKDGTKEDAHLHAELLGDDVTDHDLDLSAFEDLSDAEINAAIETHIAMHYGPEGA
jgi:hypothetical protein